MDESFVTSDFEALFAANIADQLGETEAEPRKFLRRLTRRLGPTIMTILVEAVWKIEAEGGILLPNGQRRTPGGVLFFLTKIGAAIQPWLRPPTPESVYRGRQDGI